jgi:hypothetical protein
VQQSQPRKAAEPSTATSIPAATGSDAAVGEETTLLPLKIVGQLYARRVNEDGETVGEPLVGEIIVYAPSFGDVKNIIEVEWPRLVAEIQPGAASTQS